jgi:nucleoside-diphosphate-sugar epimerase
MPVINADLTTTGPPCFLGSPSPVRVGDLSSYTNRCDMSAASSVQLSSDRRVYVVGIRGMAECIVWRHPEAYDEPGHLDVSVGEDVSTRELAEMLAEIVGHRGQLAWDKPKPDGATSKLLDVGKPSDLKCEAEFRLVDGIGSTYGWFVKPECGAGVGTGG